MLLRYLPLKFFILSLLLHLIVFTSFVFIFPIGKIPFKPEFIFLGPILTQQDMRSGNLDKKDFHSQIAPDEWTYRTHSVSENPFFTPFTQKPFSQKGGDNSEEKTILKSTFSIESKIFKREKEADSESIGVDVGVEVYRPLRFYTR